MAFLAYAVLSVLGRSHAVAAAPSTDENVARGPPLIPEFHPVALAVDAPWFGEPKLLPVVEPRVRRALNRASSTDGYTSSNTRLVETLTARRKPEPSRGT